MLSRSTVNSTSRKLWNTTDPWQNDKIAKLPIPMHTDSIYLADLVLELTDSPEDPEKIQQLETQMGFNYQQKCIIP
jgi:hypothetical protein